MTNSDPRLSADIEDVPCRVCQGRKWIAPDPTELAWFQQRYQWADLSYGCNDCPGCVQVPPEAS